MNTDEAIFKGSKGGGGSFKQTPDNLRSNDTFEAVMGVGLGPMKGPTRGLKSLKIDGTAIENETGELNFPDYIVNIGDGDPLKFPQTVTLKLGAGASPVNVGVSLTNPNATVEGPWVTRTLNNTNADFIDLRFIVNQLFRQDKKGIYDETATLQIQMKPVGKTNWLAPNLGSPSGSYSEGGVSDGIRKTLIPRSYYDAQGNWPQPTSTGYTVTGKTTSPAVYELRISVPSEGPYADTAWDIRIRLVETDSYEADPDITKRSISWESMAAVYAGTMGTHEDWRGVTWMQLYGKASDQLTGVPKITGEWDTKIVSVPPSNLYNPDTRQYMPGLWDGSFSKAFTSDPAWVINDAISDGLSGLSLIAPGSYLNKWDALEASKWFSELVPDGAGGTHPRYSLNLAIKEPQKAEEFIRYLAGAVGALAWDQGNGEWRLKCDKPDVPVDIFTLENIEGEFVHSHTDVDTRFNDITVAFKNAEMDYREDRVRLFNNASIALIGRKPTTIVAVGATNRQEAMRRGMLRLESTVGETKIVNFTTNRRGRNVDHLDLILIADADLGDRNNKTTGRMVAISEDRRTIVLRDPVYLSPGLSYSLRFSSLNPAYRPSTSGQPPANWTKPTLAYTRSVANTTSERGPVTVIKLAEALPPDVDINLAVALEAAGMVTAPKLYRVTNVVVGEDGEKISISALEVNIAKWSRSDNVSKSDTVFQDLRGAVPRPLLPGSGPLLALQKIKIEQGFQNAIVVNWKRPAGAFISGFRVTERVNGGAWQLVIDNTQQTTFEILNPVAGVHEVRVETKDRRGGYSEPLTDTLSLTQDQLNAADILYNDGSNVEDYKPAEKGADVTGDHTAANTHRVADKLAEEVIRDLGEAYSIADAARTDVALNGENLIDYALQLALDQAELDARTFFEGKPIGLYVKDEVKEVSNEVESVRQLISIMGAKNAGGTAFILDGSRVYVTPDKSLATRFEEIKSESGSDINAKIAQVNQSITDNNTATIRRFETVEGNVNQSSIALQQLNEGVVNSFSATAQQLNDIRANLNGPGGISSRISDVNRAFVDLNESTAQRFQVVESSFNNVNGSITEIREVVVDPSGANSRAVLSISAGGRVTGYRATANGQTSEFIIVAQRFAIASDDNGTAYFPFRVENGIVKATDLEVDRLKVNTAMVPSRAVSNDYVNGQYGSKNGVAEPMSMVLAAGIYVNTPGWVEVSASFISAIVGQNGPWQAIIELDNVGDSYSLRGGGLNQDAVPTQASFYVDSPGYHVVTLMWAGYTGLQLRGRSMFIKFFPGTY